MDKIQGPDFVCIGAQKAGTTWLYENLKKHTEVWTPPLKESHYFNRVCINDQLLGRWNIPHPHGIKRYVGALKSFDIKRLRWLRWYYQLGMEKEWYFELFSEKYSCGKVSGEITPEYSTIEERGVKYARSILSKDVNIIFIARNPIYRSWSTAKMLLRYRNISVNNVSSEYLIELLMSPHVTLCSEYSMIIPLWRKYFKNFHVLSYDQLSNSPREFLSKISRILGVSDKWDENILDKRVWADNKKISMPPTILKFLIAQYANEIKSLLFMKDCEFAKLWQEEINRERNK